MGATHKSMGVANSTLNRQTSSPCSPPSSGVTKDLGVTIGEALKSVVQGRKREMSEEDISELAEDPVLVDVHGHPLHDDAVKVGDWVARNLRT